MKSKVKVTKIKIQLNPGTEIKLTVEEARELQKALNDTLGAHTQLSPNPIVYLPYPYPYTSPVPYQRWEITWDGTKTTSVGDHTTSGTVSYSLRP